jgi:hypothetical protein
LGPHSVIEQSHGPIRYGYRHVINVPAIPIPAAPNKIKETDIIFVVDQRGLLDIHWSNRRDVTKMTQLMANDMPAVTHIIPIAHPAGVLGGLYAESYIICPPFANKAIPAQSAASDNTL